MASTVTLKVRVDDSEFKKLQQDVKTFEGGEIKLKISGYDTLKKLTEALKQYSKSETDAEMHLPKQAEPLLTLPMQMVQPLFQLVLTLTFQPFLFQTLPQVSSFMVLMLKWMMWIFLKLLVWVFLLMRMLLALI